MGQKLVVFHGYYGCDTGCCGHYVGYVGPETTFESWGPEDVVGEKWEFSHPDGKSVEEMRAFAEQMIRDQFGEEHVADLDWENSRIIDD